MSHAANIYVKKLKAAPNGVAISASERALLWYLADCHSEEAGGIAWPSMKTLAEHMHLGERQVRRIVGSVEKKGIIGRIAQVRENGSCQSNSFYFVELQALPIAPAARFEACAKPEKNGGKRTKNGAKAEEKPVDVSAPTLTPVSGGVGHPRQGDPDADDRETLTPVSALEAPLETPLEAPVETPVRNNNDYGGEDISLSETTSKAKTARASVSPQSTALTPLREIAAPAAFAALMRSSDKWDEFKAELVRQLERLPEKLRADAMEVFETSIRDTTLADEACDGDDLEPTWTIASANPEQTQNALNLLKANVMSALWKAAKQTVQVRVSGGGE